MKRSLKIRSISFKRLHFDIHVLAGQTARHMTSAGSKQPKPPSLWDFAAYEDEGKAFYKSLFPRQQVRQHKQMITK